jgi:hypothetical protein
MEALTLIIILVIFLIAIIIAYVIGNKIGSYKKHKEWEEELPDLRKEAIMKSRAVLGGQFSEQLAPFLPDFKYLPTECKFLGKPIDFICFKGMDEKEIGEIVFVEVKSGKSTLNPQEKALKNTIDKKKVRWEEYRIPEELQNNKKDIGNEINNFINNKKGEITFRCEDCGRIIKHRGRCFACNIKRKRVEEK